MSSMERNKGTLKYVSVDTENFSEEDFDTYRENGFLVIGREIYEVHYEVESEVDYNSFVDIKTDEKGVVHFHTLHYNGGGSLEEVLENGIWK